MTTYKEIRGTHIKTVTTDPPAPLNGQMWYNSTTRVMKGFTSSPVGTWSSANDMNRTGQVFASGIGIQTASLEVGGSQNLANVENYNGTNWTEVKVQWELELPQQH